MKTLVSEGADSRSGLIGVFPMTSHVECVALLEKLALTCGDAIRDARADDQESALGRTLGAMLAQ